MKKEKTLKEEAVEVTEAYGKAMSAYFARLKSLKGDDEEASLNRIVDVDHQLESFLERVQAHQKLVAECAAIDSQLSQIDGWVLESIRQLIEAEQATSQWLFDVRRRQSASASSVNDYEDVLYLAARMAPTTFAPPPNWAPPQPLGLHRPPNPQMGVGATSAAEPPAIDSVDNEQQQQHQQQDSDEQVASSAEFMTRVFQRQKPTQKVSKQLLQMDFSDDDD